MTISEIYDIYQQHPIVTTDSRNCPKSSIFFALKGESFDGNAFAEKALNDGCAYAIIDNPETKVNNKMILVDNVLETMQKLACLHRKTLNTSIIGITGTNGKTTTKELISTVLSQKYKTLYTEGNFNNHIGVPLTLLRLTREHEIAVIEMGANHPGEIHDLTEIVRPNYGLITNVGQAHLEGFGSFEGVIKTKGELYDFIRENGGKIFINQENEHLQKISGGLEKIMYGSEIKESTYISGQVIKHQPFMSLKWQRQNHETHIIDTHLVGDYNLWNALAAITVGQYFDVSEDKINKAISEYTPTNNRSQWKETANNVLIIDAYNANPSSMRAALENFSVLDSPHKALILGDMRELGKESLKLHEEIVRLIETQGYKKVIFCGKEFSAIRNNFLSFESVDKLNEYLKTKPLQGYHILIKGSHGIHLEKVIDNL